MNSLALASSLAAVVSAATAVVAVLRASRAFYRGAELQAFLALTLRYEQIMSTMPDARLTKDWSEDEDEHRTLRLTYLNLCSEEFYLWKTGLLSSVVWGIWEKEMRSTLA